MKKVAISFAARDALALFVTFSLVFWSGPVIQSGGYAGWLIGLLLGLLAPLFVCLLAARFPVLFGALAATCIVLSVLLADARWYSTQTRDATGYYWQHFWKRGFRGYAIIWLVAVLLSLIVSLPIHAQRRKAQPITGANAG